MHNSPQNMNALLIDFHETAVLNNIRRVMICFAIVLQLIGLVQYFILSFQAM